MNTLLTALLFSASAFCGMAANCGFTITNNSACTISCVLVYNGVAGANAGAVPGAVASSWQSVPDGLVTLVIRTNYNPFGPYNLKTLSTTMAGSGYWFYDSVSSCTPQTNILYMACVRNNASTGRTVRGWWRVNGHDVKTTLIPYGGSDCYTFNVSPSDAITWGQDYYYPTISNDGGELQVNFNNSGTAELGGNASNPIGNGGTTNTATTPTGGGSTPISSIAATNLIAWNSPSTVAARDDTLKSGFGIASAKLDTIAENVLFSADMLQTPLQEISTKTEQIGNDLVTVRTYLSNENLYAVATTNLLNSIRTNLGTATTVSTSNLTVNVNVTNNLSLSNYLAISNSVAVTNIVQFPTNGLDDDALITRLKEFAGKLFSGAGLITNTTAAQGYANDNDGGMLDAIQSAHDSISAPTIGEGGSGASSITIPLGSTSMTVDFLGGSYWSPVASFAFNFMKWVLIASFITRVAYDLYAAAQAIYTAQQMRIPNITGEIEALTFGAGGNLGVLLYPTLLVVIGVLIAVVGAFIGSALASWATYYGVLSFNPVDATGFAANGIALLKSVFPIQTAANLVVGYILFRLGLAGASAGFGIAMRAIPG